MNAAVGGLPPVLRPGPTWRTTSFTAMFGILAIGAVMIAIGEWYFAPFCLYGSVGGFRYATCRVDVFERYIVVHNPIRTIRLNWVDIERFDAVQSQSAAFAYVVRAWTRSGRIIPATRHGALARRDRRPLRVFESRLR
ncbi:MAG: hypothetical protein QOG44_3211 [Acidimicrobiaceae bacterium]|jgi:hypothetical protein|nr:hypothetical protein [Acidimicrobiaceae bacterium]